MRTGAGLLLGVLICTATATAHAEGRVRVQLVSPNQTTLSAEIAARLVELPFREGHAFKSGQVLAGFDCALFTAQRDKMEAQESLARLALVTADKLHERGMSSDLEWQQAQSKTRETTADAQAARPWQIRLLPFPRGGYAELARQSVVPARQLQLINGSYGRADPPLGQTVKTVVAQP